MKLGLSMRLGDVRLGGMGVRGVGVQSRLVREELTVQKVYICEKEQENMSREAMRF
jgi:hypothetical protein